MYRLAIVMEAADPPLSLPGPVEVRSESYVRDAEEAYKALAQVLEHLGIAEL